MNTQRWLQSLVVSRPDLYRAIYDWNVYPHRWALPEWMADAMLPTAVVGLLESSSRGRQRLGLHFSRALGLQETWWDFQDPRRRLALLSSAALARLARYAGAALLAGRLARIVAKEERRNLTARIGEDAYAFGMRHNRVQTVSGVASSETGNLAEDVEQSGWKVVFGCLAAEPEAIRARLRLKIPASIPFRASGSELGGDAVSDAWRLVQPVTREALTAEEKRCLA